MTSGALAPVLILGWGNLSRGDDALGPLFIEAVERRAAELRWPDGAGRGDGARGGAGARGGDRARGPGADAYVECVLDYQLQVEYALDLVGRERVLFVDAARSGPEPYAAQPLTAAWDPSYTTHELSPAALLHVCRTVVAQEPPPAWLLGIRGYRWELGDAPTAQALANLDAAVGWFERWLSPAAEREAQTARR